MSLSGVETYVAQENRAVRRQFVLRILATLVAGPAAAVGGYRVAAEFELLDPVVNTVALLAIALLVTTVSVTTLVVLVMARRNPRLRLLASGVAVWILTILLLEQTASGQWLQAFIVASSVVLAPLLAVFVLLGGIASTWWAYEQGEDGKMDREQRERYPN